ncbi:MAG: SUMF1/EgtB/PvdO family nonheme iron enzyme [Tepidisphaeraceae bacterium]
MISASVHAEVAISTVPVLNAGNTADSRVMNDGTTGYGQVNYSYSIGKYEVTAGQYAAFLNAVAATDTYGLYNTAMSTDTAGCQIIRSGSSGAYTYSVASDYANRPVNYVSWGDAARFSNWLSNGQPIGTQTTGTTEAGSYTLSGATSSTALMSVTRSASATWVITSENEWYKAAFYSPTSSSYYTYATSSNTLPSNDIVSPDPGNNANYEASATDSTLGAPYYRTAVGDFQNSTSPYGTFDQNGNVWEWNESTYLGLFRELRGGGIGSYADTLAASFRYIDQPNYEANSIGFRVASTVVFLPGDFNNDQLVNAADIDLLFAATQGSVPPALTKFDVTGDGTVNATPNASGSDADYWVHQLKSTEYGDANLDGKVNFSDLLVLASNYGAASGAGWAAGDFNGDTAVNFSDLLVLASSYGYENSPTGTLASDWALARTLVPEPALAFPLALAGLTLRLRRS